MNILMFDFENGHKSLGSKEGIEDMFNLPVLSPTSWSSFKNTISQLYSLQRVSCDKVVGSITIKELENKYVSKQDIDVLIFDTGTELAKKFQRELQGKAKRLSLPQWGEMKLGLDKLLEMINRFPANVIFNLHTKLIKDEELGILKYIPNIEGSTKEDIGKWFDFVFYTSIVKKDKSRQYVWITARDDRFEQAKDRSGLLDRIIPQDYSLIYNACEKRGFENAKVLIIGPPGSGKTRSLQTLLKKGK
jgi:hypothetical protein